MIAPRLRLPLAVALVVLAAGLCADAQRPKKTQPPSVTFTEFHPAPALTLDSSDMAWSSGRAKLASFQENGRELYYQTTDGVWHFTDAAVQK